MQSFSEDRLYLNLNISTTGLADYRARLRSSMKLIRIHDSWKNENNRTVSRKKLA